MALIDHLNYIVISDIWEDLCNVVVIFIMTKRRILACLANVKTLVFPVFHHSFSNLFSCKALFELPADQMILRISLRNYSDMLKFSGMLLCNIDKIPIVSLLIHQPEKSSNHSAEKCKYLRLCML